MIQKSLTKPISYFFVFLTFALLILPWSSQLISKEKGGPNNRTSKLPPDFLWCGSSDNNTYLDFCFSTEKVCKKFSLKRRDVNGGKLTLCRPTKMK